MIQLADARRRSPIEQYDQSARKDRQPADGDGG
jgi:hypothetical protein